MDQVKDLLIKVKPYAFWIACAIVVIGSLGTWYTTTGTLAEQRNSNKSKIDSAVSTIASLKSKLDEHPNDATAVGMAALNQAQGEEIARGWVLQYKRQEGVLVWPESLGADFHEAVQSLRPIEKVPYPTLVQPISDTLRRRYRDFIEDELPKLAEIIGGKWQVNREVTGGNEFSGFTQPSGPIGADGRPVTEVDRSMVLWNPANQKEILDFHYAFTTRESAPETLEVLYAQEDLWVFQNLMGIIKATNEGAEGRHDAAVKQLLFVRVGMNALGYAGQVEPVLPPDAAANPAGTYSEGPGGVNQPTYVTPPVDQSQTGVPAPSAQPMVDPRQVPGFDARDPANWRYVDSNNMPLAGVQLRTALATQTPSEADALLTVAKRVPIRMYMEIDQRKLSKLLAEMGNAPLPVEVRQLRINREPAPIGSVETMLAALGAPTAGPGGERGTFSMPSRGSSTFSGEGFSSVMPSMSGQGNLSITRDATIDTNLIKLEVYGIVYLYNPVIPGVLGLQPGVAPTAMVAPASGVGGG
jgi:hypothetical protein